LIVLDTCLLFANFAEDDDDHEVAQSIFSRILQRKYGQPIVLDYVFNELLTLIYIRTKDFNICAEVEKFLDRYVKKDVIGFVHTPNELFWKANQTFLKQDIEHQKRFLSFTDAIIGEMAEWLNASYIGTFDSQFHQFEPQIISK